MGFCRQGAADRSFIAFISKVLLIQLLWLAIPAAGTPDDTGGQKDKDIKLPNCNAAPIALPIQNVTLSNGQIRRGVEFSFGGQKPQNFSMSMSLSYNNTILKLAPGYCPDSETSSGCITRKGGTFSTNTTTTWTNKTFETFGGGDDTRRADRGIKIGAWQYGQDTLLTTDASEKQVTLSSYPLAILDDEDLPKSTLGLGPNSTIVKKLYEAGKIPSKAWSVYWGQTGTARNTFNDGTIVFGGIDRAKIIDPDQGFYEEKIPDGEDDFNTCYLRVRVEQMVLRHPDGREWNLIDERSRSGMMMCVALDYELITVPEDIADAYLKASGDTYFGREGGEYLWGMRIDGKNSFPGTLTVKLTNGYNAEIPNHQLIHPVRTISPQGEVIIRNSTEKVVRLNKLEGMNSPDLPLLGAPFLSQTYLIVDHDNNVMKFAPAKPSTEQDLEALIEGNIDGKADAAHQCINGTTTVPKPTRTNAPLSSTTPEPTGNTDTSNNNTDTKKLPIILGVVCGVIGLISIILGILLYFMRKHRKSSKGLLPAGSTTTPQHGLLNFSDADSSGLQLNQDPTFQVNALPMAMGPISSTRSLSIAPSPALSSSQELGVAPYVSTIELEARPRGYRSGIHGGGGVYIEMDAAGKK